MAYFLIALPLVAAGLAYSIASARFRALLLPCVGFLHLACLIYTLQSWKSIPPESWLGLDSLGGWFLLIISLLFFLCALHAPTYLALRPERDHRIFSTCFLSYLAMASLLTQARHPGLLWVAMEATTLATGPLVFYNRNKRSLEATWKYLVIGSVGIALALLGTLFLAYAAKMGGQVEPLLFNRLTAAAHLLSKPWLRAGFVLILIGYGTKMGLAPLHTWKPDAYGESPGIVGATLAGGVTSCAFLAILRIYSIVAVAGERAFAQELLIGFGLFSMAWALIFMVRQLDLKRMLAYSSVEHMGILALGIGIGGSATSFAIFHVAANALVKTVLFLSAGNIHRAAGSKILPDCAGAMTRTPASAWLFLLGFIAITGTPPFAPFISLFQIGAAAFSGHHELVGALFLLLLGGIYLGMSQSVLQIVFGKPNDHPTPVQFRDRFATTAPIFLALLLALALGLWLPRPLAEILESAAQLVEVRP